MATQRTLETLDRINDWWIEAWVGTFGVVSGRRRYVVQAAPFSRTTPGSDYTSRILVYTYHAIISIGNQEQNDLEVE